jgi:hypothetical protein
MPSRPVVESGLGRLRLTPAASPVDSYVKPVSAADSQLGQLASALGTVSPEVAEFGVQMGKRKGERDKAAGEQKARELYESGKSYREAIRDGLITPDQSPWFRQGAEEQMGKLAAENFNSDMIVAFAKSEYAESYEPEDFDKFAQGYMKTWAAENLPDTRTQAFNTGFSSVDGYVAGARESFAKRAGENLIKYNRDSFGASVYKSLARIQSIQGTPADMAAEVQNALDLQVAQGLNPRVANEIAAEAIIRIANETKNPSIMQAVMSQIKAGPTSLYDRPTVGLMVRQAEENIYNRRMQEDTAERMRRQEANRVATDGVLSAAVAAMRSNVNVDLDPFIAQLQTLGSPESTTASLVNLKRTMAGEKFAGDQGIANELLAYTVTVDDASDANYVTRITAANALNARRINQQDFNNIISLIERREQEDKGTAAKVLRDPLYVMFNQLLKQQFGNEMNMPAENRLGMFRASTELTNEFIHWRDGDGKSANDEQKLAFLKQLVEMKRVKFGGMFQNMKDSFTAKVPEATTTQATPDWQRGPVAGISQRQWLNISHDFVRGGGAVDSLSNDQLILLAKAGAQPETLSEFIRIQLEFNGLLTPPKKPAAAAPKR